MQFQIVNVLDAIARLPEALLQGLLASFSCPPNVSIEHFLRHHAISCAKQRFAITYLIFNGEKEIAGFFTLAHKPMFVDQKNLDGKYRRRVKQFCRQPSSQFFPNSEERLLISTFLIAQLAKNAVELVGETVSGTQLLDFAWGIFENVQKAIGGGVISLECENQPKLLEFYQKYGFRKFGERISEATGEFYHQLLQVF